MKIGMLLLKEVCRFDNRWHKEKRKVYDQNQPYKSHPLPFDHGIQIVIPPRSPASVPGSIETPSDDILHQSK